MLVESWIEPVERLLTAECVNSVAFDGKYVNANSAIDSLKYAVKLCDLDCKYAMSFVVCNVATVVLVLCRDIQVNKD